MSFDQLIRNVEELPQKEQDRLAAFLVTLRHRRDDAIKKEMADRIDDKNRANWLTLDELREKWKG